MFDRKPRQIVVKTTAICQLFTLLSSVAGKGDEDARNLVARRMRTCRSEEYDICCQKPNRALRKGQPWILA